MEIWAYIVYYTWTETLALNCHLIVRKCWSFFVFFFVLNFGEDFYAAFWLKICLDQDCAKTGKSTQPLDRLFKMTSAKAAHSQFIHCLSEQFDMCKMCLFMIHSVMFIVQCLSAQFVGAGKVGMFKHRCLGRAAMLLAPDWYKMMKIDNIWIWVKKIEL